jgi:superfamily II DNA or RNA helicase
VNYVQVDYGHGKTYVILLAAKHIVKETKKKVLILVLNDALVKQMNEAITMLRLPS